jgi:hypothetical protein
VGRHACCTRTTRGTKTRALLVRPDRRTHKWAFTCPSEHTHFNLPGTGHHFRATSISCIADVVGAHGGRDDSSRRCVGRKQAFKGEIH